MRPILVALCFVCIHMTLLPVVRAELLPGLTVLAYHDVREDIKGNYAPDPFAISAENLAMQFAWLRDQNYNVVSMDEVRDALAGKRRLPERSVLLTFDDGLASVHSSVLPLLKLFDYPALISVVTSWIETDVEVQYENRLLSSRDFLSWEQLRELAASGLVELASHSHDLHRGLIANPQRNEQPAATSRIFADTYESRSEYLQRIEADLARSARLLATRAGQAPQAVVWPYGQYNDALRNLAGLHGMSLSFSLDPDFSDLRAFPVLGRQLIIANPDISRFANMLQGVPAAEVLRAAQVDLDYVYDPDPAVQERNLGLLLDRIKALGISHVFLQAFADPDGNGAADALYFPNRHLPMRADLFNRVAWQLRTRAGVRVFAWMPLLAFEGAAVPVSWQVLQATSDGVEPDPLGEPRLSPFVPEARAFIRDIYTDLAIHSNFDGIHFHDDGRLSDLEDANPLAIAAYQAELGPDFSIAMARDDAALDQRWADLKARTLLALSAELVETVAAYRPVLKTSRNMFASALLDPQGSRYLAQDFDAFLQHYDFVTVMAMPQLEQAADEDRFFAQLIAGVRLRPGAMMQTVFQLQTVDWRGDTRQLPADGLRDRMRALQSEGVRNLAYYPDDFHLDHPRLTDLRQGISLASDPVLP